MVKVNNATQSVDNALCEDAGLSLPEVVEKCGGVECSRWIAGEWTPCLTSRCLSRHRAAQIREVNCHSVNGSTTNSCDESERPIARQECENERCKPVWRVENWSEVISYSQYHWDIKQIPHYIIVIKPLPSLPSSSSPHSAPIHLPILVKCFAQFIPSY